MRCAAGQQGAGVTFFTVGRIQRLLNRRERSLKGASILALEAAFEKDVEDARNSVAVRVIETLLSQSAEVQYPDPVRPRDHDRDVSLRRRGRAAASPTRSVELRPRPQGGLRRPAVGHSAVDHAMVLANASAVFDGVNATRGFETEADLEPV